MIEIACLSCAEEMGKSNPAVVHFKLEYTVNVRDLKTTLVFSTWLFHQEGTDEWVDTNKFQLDVISLIGNPFFTLQLFNRDGIYDVLHDCVCCGSALLSSLVVSHILDFDHTGLLEHPLAERSSHFLVSRLLVQLTTLNETELVPIDKIKILNFATHDK